MIAFGVWSQLEGRAGPGSAHPDNGAAHLRISVPGMRRLRISGTEIRQTEIRRRYLGSAHPPHADGAAPCRLLEFRTSNTRHANRAPRLRRYGRRRYDGDISGTEISPGRRYTQMRCPPSPARRCAVSAEPASEPATISRSAPRGEKYISRSAAAGQRRRFRSVAPATLEGG